MSPVSLSSPRLSPSTDLLPRASFAPLDESVQLDGAVQAPEAQPDRIEPKSFSRFSPLCQRVLLREHHKAFARPMPKMPVAEERLGFNSPAKDIEALDAHGFTPAMLQPLIDCDAGDSLISLLCRFKKRLVRWGFTPDLSAPLLELLYVRRKRSVAEIEQFLISIGVLAKGGYPLDALHLLIGCEQGDELILLLCHNKRRLEYWDFAPETSAKMFFDLHTRHNLTAIQINMLLVALIVNNVDGYSYEQIAEGPRCADMLSFIANNCRRLSCLPLGGETFVAAAHSSGVFALLNTLMFSWNYLSYLGTPEEQVPSMLSLGMLDKAVERYWAQA